MAERAQLTLSVVYPDLGLEGPVELEQVYEFRFCDICGSRGRYFWRDAPDIDSTLCPHCLVEGVAYGNAILVPNVYADDVYTAINDIVVPVRPDEQP